MKQLSIVIHQWLPNEPKTTFTIPLSENVTIEGSKELAFNLWANSEDLTDVNVLEGDTVIYSAVKNK